MTRIGSETVLTALARSDELTRKISLPESMSSAAAAADAAADAEELYAHANLVQVIPEKSSLCSVATASSEELASAGVLGTPASVDSPAQHLTPENTVSAADGVHPRLSQQNSLDKQPLPLPPDTG